MPVLALAHSSTPHTPGTWQVHHGFKGLMDEVTKGRVNPPAASSGAGSQDELYKNAKAKSPVPIWASEVSFWNQARLERKGQGRGLGGNPSLGEAVPGRRGGLSGIPCLLQQVCVCTAFWAVAAQG